MIYSSWYNWHVCGFPVIFIAVKMAAGNHSFFTIRTSLLGEKNNMHSPFKYIVIQYT